jgi:hypothetical protein
MHLAAEEYPQANIASDLLNHTHDMNSVSKLLRFACVLLTLVLWSVTLVTEPTRGPIVPALDNHI